MSNYLMKTECGNQYPLTTENPVHKDDEVYYKSDVYLVLVVKHRAGGGSTVVCRKMEENTE